MYFFKGISTVYKLGCFIGFIFVVYFLFQKYFANESTSIVEMSPFEHDHTRASFPAVTLCFYSDENKEGLFDNQYLLSILGLRGSQYRDALLGMENDFNIARLLDSSFEMATIKLHNFMKKVRIQDTNDVDVMKWQDKDRSNISTFPMVINYQDPTLICYNHHTDLDPHIAIDSLDLYFYISKLHN